MSAFQDILQALAAWIGSLGGMRYDHARSHCIQMDTPVNGCHKFIYFAGAAAVTSLVAALTATPSKAVIQTYFGFDKQICQPPGTFAAGNGCGEGTILRNYPNSQQAEQAFLSNLIGVQTETFQGFRPPAGVTGINANGLVLPFNGGAFTGTLSGSVNLTRVNYGNTLQSENGGGAGGGQYGIAPDTSCLPQSNVPSNTTNCLNQQQLTAPLLPNTSGSINPQRFLRVSAGTTGSSSNYTVTFSQPVAAFGFYGIDIGDFGATVSVTTRLGGNPLNTYVVQNATNTATCNQTYPGLTGGNNTQQNRIYNNCNGAVLFFGLIGFDGEVLDGITFTSVGGSSVADTFTFDNFTVGRRENVIPAPLPLTGLLPLGVAMKKLARKRRHLLIQSVR